MKKSALPLVLCCILLAAAFAARRAAARTWDALTRYASPYALANGFSPARPNTAQTQHLVLVLVDGLGEDASRNMPFLNALRSRGADVRARAGLPSLSLPGRATLVTGAWQSAHGQVTNFNARLLPAGHLFDALHRASMTAALAAHAGTHTMVGPDHLSVVYTSAPHGGPGAPDMAAFERELHESAAAARALYKSAPVNFAQIDLLITDEVGHAFGANSEQYRRAARLADDEIRSIASMLDLSRDVLIVTSDHGHLGVGGHGGPEELVLRVPLVMAGAGIRAGASIAAEQVDVAPTIATLLGVEIPAMNEGRVLLDALALSPAQRAEAWRALAAQRERAAGVMMRVIEPSGAPPAARAGATDSAYVSQLDGAIAARRTAREAREVRTRATRVLAIALLPLLMLAVASRFGATTGTEMAYTTLGTVAALALYGALFGVAGLGYSFSAVNAEEHLGAFFNRAMTLALVATATGVVVAVTWRRRGGTASPLDLARLGLGVSALTAYLFGAAALATHARFGVVMHWEVPNMFWGFGFYLDMLSLMAVGFAAPVMAVLAVGLGWARPRGAAQRSPVH
jgi:hypothetical protein